MMELYKEDLETIIKAMDHLDVLASIDNVFEVEIRLRVADTNEWAVLGFGESGDPCILRFDSDIAPVAPPAFPTTFPNPGSGITWNKSYPNQPLGE